MPLSFAAQLGGSMTLLGSSHCLVAAGAFASSGYTMEFFDLTPIGAMLTIFSAISIWLVVKLTTLLRSSAHVVKANDEEEDTVQDMYAWKFYVEPGGGLVGKTLEDVGMDRLPGVAKVAFADGIDRAMHGHDTLVAMATERGIAQLRKIPGVYPCNHADLSALGRQRHRRFLYEVGIRPDSTIFANGLPDAEAMRHIFVGAFVAGPKIPYSLGDAADAELPPIGGNCVILLEADERAVSDKAVWSQEFLLVHKVLFSNPPRQGLPVDKFRTIATFLGFVILIAGDSQGPRCETRLWWWPSLLSIHLHSGPDSFRLHEVLQSVNPWDNCRCTGYGCRIGTVWVCKLPCQYDGKDGRAFWHCGHDGHDLHHLLANGTRHQQ